MINLIQVMNPVFTPGLTYININLVGSDSVKFINIILMYNNFNRHNGYYTLSDLAKKSTYIV